MNSEQHNALKTVQNGHNVLITGSAGTGKSYLLSHIIKWARSVRYSVAVTASTGSAAYLLRGRTIHSFLGIGLAKKNASELAKNIIENKQFIAKRIRDLNILIVDEISMIDDELFDKISQVLSIIRRSNKAFGGVQLVLCGDFCQLPAVNGKYCFKAIEWQRANIQIVMLKTLMRQNKDKEFASILEEIRWGHCSKETKQRLKSLKNTVFKGGIIPSILYSTNVDVESINEKRFQELVDKGAVIKTFTTTYSAGTSGKMWADLLKIPESISLCIGAQVVLTWNLDQENGLVNGSRGMVTELTDQGPTVMFTNGSKVVIEAQKVNQEENQNHWVTFIPLKLAYALTIHKSQGMTLDAVVLDLGTSIFEYGQAYTALSRVRDLNSVCILNVRTSSFKVHKDVLHFYGKNPTNA
jgi:ATP-dependent DNA helicase PIF1